MSQLKKNRTKCVSKGTKKKVIQSKRSGTEDEVWLRRHSAIKICHSWENSRHVNPNQIWTMRRKRRDVLRFRNQQRNTRCESADSSAAALSHFTILLISNISLEIPPAEWGFPSSPCLTTLTGLSECTVVHRVGEKKKTKSLCSFRETKANEGWLLLLPINYDRSKQRMSLMR